MLTAFDFNPTITDPDLLRRMVWFQGIQTGIQYNVDSKNIVDEEAKANQMWFACSHLAL